MHTTRGNATNQHKAVNKGMASRSIPCKRRCILKEGHQERVPTAQLKREKLTHKKEKEGRKQKPLTNPQNHL